MFFERCVVINARCVKASKFSHNTYSCNQLELARLQNEELKKENERLKLQTNDLWNLLANEGFNSEEQYIIEALIEGNGEEYVKRVFAEYAGQAEDDSSDDEEEF